MSVARRTVRVSESFFEQLDDILGEDRGSDGSLPSSTDFLVIELPAIVELFATSFDLLPETISGVSAGRMLIGSGALVYAFVVFGLLVSQDTVELIGIDIDLQNN